MLPTVYSFGVSMLDGKTPNPAKEEKMTVDTYSLYGSVAYPTYYTGVTAKASREELADALFKTIDADESGGIDKVEFSQAALELSKISDKEAAEEAFAAMDTDGDGTLSFEELLSGLEASASAGVASAAPPPPPPPPPSSSDEEDEDDTLLQASSSSSSVADPADTDGDGTVTAAEAMAYQASLKEANTSTSTKNLMQLLMANIIASYSTSSTPSASALNLSA